MTMNGSLGISFGVGFTFLLFVHPFNYLQLPCLLGFNPFLAIKVKYLRKKDSSFVCCRTAQTASAYYWMECLCQCQATRNRRLCHIHQVLTPLFLIRYDYKYYNLYFLLFRNERNQLLLGIRHATRPQTIVPSSMLSSDSMHIGLLAAAAHAAATNSCFTVFYHPRLLNSFFLLSLSLKCVR